MRNSTHQLVGVTCALAAFRTLELDAVDGVAVCAAAVCGSWLPDADRPGTRVHRRSELERRNLVIGALGMVLRMPLVVFALVSRHRGISHSLIACAALAVTAAVCGPPLPDPGAALLAGLALGYASHVAADGCTPHGVRLWAPFSSRRVCFVPRRARIRSGSVRERLFAAACVLVAVALVLV